MWSRAGLLGRFRRGGLTVQRGFHRVALAKSTRACTSVGPALRATRLRINLARRRRGQSVAVLEIHICRRRRLSCVPHLVVNSRRSCRHWEKARWQEIGVRARRLQLLVREENSCCGECVRQRVNTGFRVVDGLHTFRYGVGRCRETNMRRKSQRDREKKSVREEGAWIREIVSSRVEENETATVEENPATQSTAAPAPHTQVPAESLRPACCVVRCTTSQAGRCSYPVCLCER
jgi:hypothetical protein